MQAEHPSSHIFSSCVVSVLVLFFRLAHNYVHAGICCVLCKLCHPLRLSSLSLSLSHPLSFSLSLSLPLSLSLSLSLSHNFCLTQSHTNMFSPSKDMPYHWSIRSAAIYKVAHFSCLLVLSMWYCADGAMRVCVCVCVWGGGGG